MQASEATYPDPKTVTASEVLTGLRGIIEREQMGHDGYISWEVNQELAKAGALCRGHRACAVGSTWLAAGVAPHPRSVGGSRSGSKFFELPGVEGGHEDRLEWLAAQGYRGLLRAYVALCDAAQEYMDARGLSVGVGWKGAGALEGLFESEHDEYDADGGPRGRAYLIEPRDMLVVIDSAEELIA
jgi:hypothetical protein